MVRRFKLSVFLTLLLLVFIATPVTYKIIAGNSNIDNGSGNMGNGTSTDKWSNEDGVRVTVVTVDSSIAAVPIDLTNFSISSKVIHFGKISKLQYSKGTALAPNSKPYLSSKPGTPLPRIISGSVNKADIKEIRKYFASEYVAKYISKKSGIPFTELVSGDYKLVIEPIGYFIHGSKNYAMTATEAALYNQKSGGTLKSKMPSLTHQNLPLSIYLEKPDLGYPVWKGTTTSRVTDAEILSSLGIGIVTYKDVPTDDSSTTPDPEVEIEAPDVTYRTDTDVITSIMLHTTSEITPKSPAKVTFTIEGKTYKVNNIVIPEDGSQLVWVKWHTPSTPGKVTITASVSGASTSKTSFKAKIESLDENPPPDPQATDRNAKYTLVSEPSNPQNTSSTWGVWSAEWEEDWKWVSNWVWRSEGHSSSCDEDCSGGHGYYRDDGYYKDFGKWIYEYTSYYATLNGTMNAMPDDIVPTASGKKMKSGYGIKNDVKANIITNASSSHYSVAQTAVSYFPEFKYKKYWRLLQYTISGKNTSFQFKPNEYSTYNRNVHFLPVWYPDNVDYQLYTYVIDAWTPAGMLSVNLTDVLEIDGSVFDDWYTKRE